MIVGNPAVFALESHIGRAYARLSLRALGFFLIHIRGMSYGVRSSDATMLACSYDGVERRIRRRGTHTAPFAAEVHSMQIADAISRGLYEEGPDDELFLGMPRAELGELVYSRHLLWAPDGDEAFDDGSYVLQFDVYDQVRLIAFRRTADGTPYEPNTLNEAFIPADEFYRILTDWLAAFQTVWMSLPREPDEET